MRPLSLQKLQELITELESKIKAAPEGFLKICHAPNYQFYQSVDNNDTYVPKKNMALIRALAQKGYEKDLLILAKKELKRLNKEVKPFDLTLPYANLTVTRKRLVTPRLIPDKDFQRIWENLKYESSNTEYEYVTDKGERVRSKSELLIANKLYKEHIPYHYEKPLKVLERTIIPDFTILDVDTRQIIVWEHFGMMSDDVYRRTALIKINNYALAGYVLGVNLIASFEEEGFPINTLVIDSIIREIKRKLIGK